MLAMGEAKRKRERFLTEHPVCCFCGGSEPATTVDHVPARTCFRGRAGPEGFEFPACANCQSASRLDELAFGFFVRLASHDEEGFDREGARKALEGLRNNLPELMPDFGLSANEKKKRLREMGLVIPTGTAAGDFPIAAIPPEVHRRLLRYAAKIACALYYKEMGNAPAEDFNIFSLWWQALDPRANDIVAKLVEMTPMLEVGSRPNLNFGDQFMYRFNKSENPELFAAIAQFGKGGLMLAMFVVNPSTAEGVSGGPWIKVRDIFA